MAQVLAEHGVPMESHLSASYPSREYVVQYDETDFDFVNRMLEHWGIFFYFDHRPDGEVMVLGDGPSAFVELPDHAEVAFRPTAGAVEWSGHVNHLTRQHRVCTGNVTVVDYNWRTPNAQPTGGAPADEHAGHGTQTFYGEHVKDGGEAAVIARARAEALISGRETYRAQATVQGLQPGHRFQLDDHPSGALNQEYAVTRVDLSIHRGGAAGGEGRERAHRMELIPYGAPWRPPRVTPKPRIEGLLPGLIDSGGGAGAPIDELGRYKVVLPFDAVGAKGGAASRWIRMAQSSTGPGYGMHFPLRPGVEVAIAHTCGDPDRPIIVGAVPNANSVTPVTSAESMKSRIRTRTGIVMEFIDGA